MNISVRGVDKKVSIGICDKKSIQPTDNILFYSTQLNGLNGGATVIKFLHDYLDQFGDKFDDIIGVGFNNMEEIKYFDSLLQWISVDKIFKKYIEPIDMIMEKQMLDKKSNKKLKNILLIVERAGGYGSSDELKNIQCLSKSKELNITCLHLNQCTIIDYGSHFALWDYLIFSEPAGEYTYSKLSKQFFFDYPCCDLSDIFRVLRSDAILALNLKRHRERGDSIFNHLGVYHINVDAVPKKIDFTLVKKDIESKICDEIILRNQKHFENLEKSMNIIFDHLIIELKNKIFEIVDSGKSKCLKYDLDNINPKLTLYCKEWEIISNSFESWNIFSKLLEKLSIWSTAHGLNATIHSREIKISWDHIT